MIVRWIIICASLSVGLFLSVQAQAQATKQTQDVLGQVPDDDCVAVPFEGARPLVPDGAASVIRTPNGFSAVFSMPTPATGTYCYPPGTVPGFPEVFTLWGIYFNEPDQCLDGPLGCGVLDVLGPNCSNVHAGAIKLAGHIAGGGQLHLAGHISVGEDPFIGCSPLEDPAEAVIHLAVAPHGLLDPSMLPGQIQTPTAGGPGYWYPAFFDPE